MVELRKITIRINAADPGMIVEIADGPTDEDIEEGKWERFADCRAVQNISFRNQGADEEYCVRAEFVCRINKQTQQFKTPEELSSFCLHPSMPLHDACDNCDKLPVWRILGRTQLALCEDNQRSGVFFWAIRCC